MSLRNIIALLALVPAMAWAQSPVQETTNRASDAQGPLQETLRERVVRGPIGIGPAGTDAPNALTMQVIMAQRPSGISEEQWWKMMLDPLNASLYPIRLTQAMLDTIDATQLDLRYRYMMVR